LAHFTRIDTNYHRSLAFSVRLFVFCIWNITTFGSMKKGSKLSDTHYTVTITNLHRDSVFTAGGSSLRELVGLIRDFVPSMDNYSKVYREMRQNVGVYMGLFVLPAERKKVRHVVVTIEPDILLEADLKRFYNRIDKLPDPFEGVDIDAMIKSAEAAEKALSE
jgi:hypothetical protein